MDGSILKLSSEFKLSKLTISTAIIMMEAITVDHPTTAMESDFTGAVVGCAGCMEISNTFSLLRDTNTSHEAGDGDSEKDVRSDIDRGKKLSERVREMQELEDGRHPKREGKTARLHESVREIESEQ
jgi:hypothetical protein